MTYLRCRAGNICVASAVNKSMTGWPHTYDRKGGCPLLSNESCDVQYVAMESIPTMQSRFCVSEIILKHGVAMLCLLTTK